MPRARSPEGRIRDAMDGKKPLGAKDKRQLSAESSSSSMSFKEFVKRLTSAQKRGLYDALVGQMEDTDYEDVEEEDEDE